MTLRLMQYQQLDKLLLNLLKTSARDAINQKANEQTTSINANNNATDEEKQKLILE